MIEVIEDGAEAPRTVALFPEDRTEGPLPDASIVAIRLSAMRLKRPRRWGARWLALRLWQRLDLDVFYAGRLVRVEEAFRTPKSDLAIRPAYHQLPLRSGCAHDKSTT